MTVLPNRKVRNRIGRKSLKHKALSRQLRMESLERRELMAADIAPFHNYLMPQDVDGDYRVSPLDALIVINQLNSVGTGSLADKAPPSTRSGLIDTNADNFISPLDALTIINTLNGGEGETIKAAVRYEFYALNADGSIGGNLDPNPNDSVSEALVNTGEKFVVRTLMADFRNNPFGVFSAYHDLNFVNADGNTDERVELQWSDYNALKFSMPDLGQGSIAVLTGNFKLQYGTETTASIEIATRIPGTNRPPVTDVTVTAQRIQAAIEQLPSIGAGNAVVRVNTIDPDLGYNFDIFFRNEKARVDIPNPTIVDANLTVSEGPPATATISGITNPNANNADAVRSALNYIFPSQTPLYVNGPNGFVTNISGTPGGRVINLLGGFSNSSATIPQPEAFDFFNIVDTAFVAGFAGEVNLQGAVSPLPTGGGTGNNLGIALYNDGGAYLTASQVTFENAVIRIIDRLSADDDEFSVNEDSGTTVLDVSVGDVDLDGNPFGIVAVTQPSGGAGTVAFDAGGAAKTVRFTPTQNFFGVTTFTYTIRNSIGLSSTANVTVTVNPINDAPVVIGTSFNATEDQLTPLTIAPTSIFNPGPANESSQSLTLAIVTGPTAAQGTASINTTTGNLEFSPATDFFGPVTIVVRGTDSGPNTPAPNVNNSLATLTITVASVNDAPRIVQTTFSVNEDPTSPLSITPAQIFTPGPANESSQLVTLEIVSGPSAGQGTASIAANGSLQFSPASNFFGNVILQIRGTDNGSPVEATITPLTITVQPVNDPPTAVPDVDGARLNAIGLTSTSTPLDVMANDSPGPGESAIDTIRLVAFTTTTTSLGGTVALNNDRTRVIYTPPVSAVNVVDSFTYTIEDSAGLTSSALAEVFVFPPVLPYAIDDSRTIAEVATDTDFPFDVLINDLFNEGEIPRIVDIVTQPSFGQASVAGTGTPGDPSDDRLVYRAPAFLNGTVSVRYSMTDSADESDPAAAVLTIRITEVNSAPVAVGKSASGTEDETATILGSTITSGLSKGPNEDNQSLTVTGATLLTSGSGSVSLVNGNIVFVPVKDFFGPVLIRYTVTDNGTTNGLPDPKSASATLTLTIDPVNDSPITSPKSFDADEDTSRPIAISAVIAGDLPGPSNESSQTVSFVPLTGPITTSAGGTITQSGDELLYTPADDFNGTDTFTYQITDGQEENQFAIGTVTITVSEVNDAPVADNIRKTVFAGVASVIDVSAELAAMSRGAANEAGQTLLISRLLTDPAIGTILGQTGTSVTFFAPLGTDGTTSFTFEVIDNGTTGGESDPLTSTATFTIDILPFVPSSLKGTVYIDDNANGVLDRSQSGEMLELPVGGVEVTLSYDDPANPGRQIIVTEMSAADGSYDFELLPPAAYTVSYSTPLHMTEDASLVKSYTVNINPPGDVNNVFDFGLLGIIPEYGSHLEYLASSFYNKDGTLRSRGMYAAINADGITDWTSRKDGFGQDMFHEVVLSNDGSRAYLTAVRGQGEIYTATLIDKRQFIRLPIASGGQLIRILASSAELNWVPVNPAAPPVSARGYLETVDDFYRQEGWNW